MEKYLIEEAKCGITDGGMACGPVAGTVVAEVKFKKGRKTKGETTSGHWKRPVE